MTTKSDTSLMDVPQKLHCILNSLDLTSTDFSVSICEGDDLARLETWNNEIEASFGSPFPAKEENIESTLQSLKDSTDLLHQKLMECILKFVDMKLYDEGESFFFFDTEENANQTCLKISGYLTTTTNAGMKLAAFASKEEGNGAIWILLSELLRACKNSIRWKRHMWMQRYKPCPMNPICRLQGVGMIQLLLHLLLISEPNEERRDDVARSASLVLFHATFGQAEVETSKARAGFVHHGIPILMKLFLGEHHSTPFMLSLVRHIHNLISTIEGVIVTMNQELSNHRNDDDTCNLFTVLVAKLSQMVHSDQPTNFPGSGDNVTDRRSDLAIEIIRVLFVLSNRGKESVNDLEQKYRESMKELGFLLVDILLLDNTNVKAYECKLAAIQLLMDSPPEYGQFLVQKNAIGPLLTIFSLQLSKLINDAHADRVIHGAQHAALILPILIVLNKLAVSNSDIRVSVREFVFPPEREDAFLAKVKEEKALSQTGDGKIGAKNMKPIDAPKNTLRWKLIKLMTWPETSVKRCAGELLWNICNGNSTEFVLRLGFGNAVHFLSIKGLVKIPDQSTVVTNSTVGL